MTETSVDLAMHARSLVLGYGDSRIIHDVTLRAEPAKITAILGPNGSGKSTLMKGLCGLLSPISGQLELFGKDVTGWETSKLVRSSLGYVPQVKNVFSSLTVRENLDLGAATCRPLRHERMERVFELFPDLHVAQKKTARVLSGGQRNMLALGRALMTEPRLLLVDEPTAGLSPKYAEAVWDHLIRIRESGLGVIVVEQNVEAALENADAVYLLVSGSVAFEGSGSDLASDVNLANSFLGGVDRKTNG